MCWVKKLITLDPFIGLFILRICAEERQQGWRKAEQTGHILCLHPQRQTYASVDALCRFTDDALAASSETLCRGSLDPFVRWERGDSKKLSGCALPSTNILWRYTDRKTLPYSLYLYINRYLYIYVDIKRSIWNNSGSLVASFSLRIQCKWWIHRTLSMFKLELFECSFNSNTDCQSDQYPTVEELSTRVWCSKKKEKVFTLSVHCK